MNMNKILESSFEKLSILDEEKIVLKLSEQMKTEYNKSDRSGIYAKTQKLMAYNSNKIEGSTLTPDQTASLFDTGTILASGEIFKAKDIEEMTGHFSMFNEMLKTLGTPLSEDLIKRFHFRLKSGVFEDLANGYPIGEYKNRVNQVSNITTVRPDQVSNKMQELLKNYNTNKKHTLDELAWFHSQFEKIHPFQDGNGRTGRIILFKECIESGIIPVIITDKNKASYYHALNAAQTTDNYENLWTFFRQEQKDYYSVIQEFLYEYVKDNEKTVEQLITEAKND